MPRTSPIFGFTIPDENSYLHELGDELGDTVEQLEAVLADRAAVPGLGDLNAVVAQLNTLARVEIYRDTIAANNSAGGGSTLTIHGGITGRVLDPAALFGAGYGAHVKIESRVLIDVASPGGWYLRLQRNAVVAGVPGSPVTIAEDHTPLAGRSVLDAEDSQKIAPGEVAAFRTVLFSPGGTGTASFYADATNNRTVYTVRPYKP